MIKYNDKRRRRRRNMAVDVERAVNPTLEDPEGIAKLQLAQVTSRVSRTLRTFL
jgi:hypothetical protein